MPMPPPKPSTEGPRDRGVHAEIKQIVRALRANGPCSIEELSRLVGADYWDSGKFARAVAIAVADGEVVRGPAGELQVSG